MNYNVQLPLSQKIGLHQPSPSSSVMTVPSSPTKLTTALIFEVVNFFMFFYSLPLKCGLWIL